MFVWETHVCLMSVFLHSELVILARTEVSLWVASKRCVNVLNVNKRVVFRQKWTRFLRFLWIYFEYYQEYMNNDIKLTDYIQNVMGKTGEHSAVF